VQGIINYIISTPQPVFYKTTDTRDNIHIGFKIADELKAVINGLGPQKVFALLTAYGCEHEGCLEESYPHITPIGCAAHTLNLLLKDIMALKTLDTLYKRAKELVRYVKVHQVRAAINLTKQSEKNKAAQQHPGEVVLSSCLPVSWRGRSLSKEMAISHSVDMNSHIKRILLDYVFWERVVSSLKPIAVAITRIEGDNAILSDVQTLLADVKEEIRTALSTYLLLQAEETAVLKYINKHEDFCLNPIHATVYKLDPKYSGKNILSGTEINKAYGVITTVSRHLGLEEGKVLGSLAKYTSKQGLWDGDGIWQSCQHMSSATWWKGLCGSEAHSPVASITLQIPPKSTASERNLSLFGNTRTKARNRLISTRLEKLVAIRANLRLFEPDNEPSSTRLGSDSEDEA
jgi:hypothetical protein